MIEYRFATEADRADVIDFINYVFSQNSVPHDFKTLIPKVYADGRGYNDIHAIVMEDGHVKGVAAQYPIHCTYGGEEIKIGYIGSVSTHKYSRGRGFMIRLMEMQIASAREKGYALMLLGGQRQRYEYYGFSHCGEQYQYRITATNIRHALKNTAVSGLNWKRFQDASEAEIDSAYEIYLSQPLTGARPREDFDIVLRTWNCEPYVLLDGERVIGYLDASGKESISELILSDAAFAPAFIKAWCSVYALNQLNLVLPSFDVPLNRAVSAFAESYSRTNATHLRIINFPNAVKACLALKKKTTGLSDGRIVLKMEDEPAVCAEVENGEIRVFETDKTPDIVLSRLDMQQFLFASNRFAAPAVSCPVDWFPLPVFLYGPDHF